MLFLCFFFCIIFLLMMRLLLLHGRLVFSLRGKAVKPSSIDECGLRLWDVLVQAFPCLKRWLLKSASVGEAHIPGKIRILPVHGIQMRRSLRRGLAAG